MIRKIVSLAFIASVVLVACKKSGSSSNDSSAIQGKWNLTRNVSSIYVNGALVDSGHTDVSSLDYIYFYANGSVISYENDNNSNNQAISDTASYKILNNQFLVINAPSEIDTLKIQTLTSNSLILTDSYTESNGGITSITYDTVQYTK